LSLATRGPPGAPSGDDRRVSTVAARLDADPRFTGKGVTIAFLDSGFFAHDELTKPRDRIIAYHDLGAPRAGRRALREPDVSSWHGMMTSVVAAGNGAYPGLASEADLVLVKVGSAARIVHDDIGRGLRWVTARRERHRTRVINISCGGDYEASYLTDALSCAAEAASRAGIVVVAAVGNGGGSPRPIVLPPASAPSVIAVGGIDDGGGPGAEISGYHSSYGPTIDGLQKPDLVAPAIWIAAPILPGSEVARHAALLDDLHRAKDTELAAILGAWPGIHADLEATLGQGASFVRELVAAKRRAQQVLSATVKHVDGTSFAAPIVSSVVAQMLEAKPSLTPSAVRRILIATARPLPGIPRDRQGFGLIQPRAAVEAALAS
jgi:serine protease AprX